MGASSSAEEVLQFVRNIWAVGLCDEQTINASAIRVDGEFLQLSSELVIRQVIKSYTKVPIGRLVLLKTWKQLFPKLPQLLPDDDKVPELLEMTDDEKRFDQLESLPCGHTSGELDGTKWRIYCICIQWLAQFHRLARLVPREFNRSPEYARWLSRDPSSADDDDMLLPELDYNIFVLHEYFLYYIINIWM